MSQAGIINTSSGAVPPTVPTSFVTQNGIAVPLANILIIDGFDSTENNDNGITTKGGVAGTGTQNEVDVVITNRIQNKVTTVDATPTAVSTFALGATPGVYTFDVNIAGFDTTDILGVGYSLFGTIRTTGAAGTLCGSVDKIVNEENATVFPCTATIIASGNNAIIQVTGLAGKIINWNSVTTYLFVS